MKSTFARWAPKVAAVLALAIVTLAVDRLSHLPSSAPLANDKALTVPFGSHLELTGPQGPALLQIETAAGDGVTLVAGPANLETPQARRVRDLSWVVSGDQGGAGDNKVHLEIALSRPDPAAVVYIERTGEALRPELRISSPNASLVVRAGLLFGAGLQMPHKTALLADAATFEPTVDLGFTLQPGGRLSLTFPVYPDGTPKGMTFGVGDEDPLGPRLWLDQVGVVADGQSQPLQSVCASPAGRQLWPVLLRPSISFRPGDCLTGHTLAAREFGIDQEEMTVRLTGSAFTLSDDPPLSHWYNWVKDSPILGLALGILYTALVGWVWKTVTDWKGNCSPRQRGDMGGVGADDVADRL